ncbi:MAG: hypothetical protein AB7S39_11700 [Gemmatimonadales bacterium]
MLAHCASSTRTVGFRSAVLATVFSLMYVFAQLAEWAGWLGSAGGPDSPSTAAGLAILLTPSLLLGPSFLVLMVCVDLITPRERKVWSRTAVVFATVYTTMIAINYYVQLA